MSASQSKYRCFLVYGFVREQEKVLKLSMHITEVIIELIIELFPLIVMQFGKGYGALFNLSDDGLLIKARNHVDGPYYAKYRILYPDNEGFDKGIHVWSIKLVPKSWKSKYLPFQDPKRIGITTNKDSWEELDIDLALRPDRNWFEADKVWVAESILTIKLDCTLWKISFYINDKKMNEEKIESNKYFIGLCIPYNRTYFHYQIVDTPTKISMR